MYSEVIIHCDRCDSTDVLHEEIVHVAPPQHKTMTEIVAESRAASITHDVYHIPQYRMVCKACGHIVKYSPGTIPL